jgi:uncharacterized protein (TIGR04255 family)
MPLTFPSHPDVVFDRAPLLVVLCQVKYPPILSLLTPAGVAGFQEAIRDAYPVLQPEAGAQIELGPSGLAVSEQTPVWRLSSQDTRWRVSIASDMVALEAFAYTSIDEFSDRLSVVLDALRRTVYPEPSARVGLRKVNDIEHPEVSQPRDWVRWLRPDILGLLASDELGGDVTLAFSQVHLEDGEEVLAIRHGSLPETLQKYRLDLDYFTSKPMTVEADGEMIQTVRRFAAGATALFHWCLTRDLYEWLGPRPRGEVTRSGDGDT